MGTVTVTILHSVSVGVKPLDVSAGLDEHFGGLVFTECELLREGTDGIFEKALLIHGRGLPLF